MKPPERLCVRPSAAPILGIDAEAPLKQGAEVGTAYSGGAILGIDAEAPLKQDGWLASGVFSISILGIDAEAPLKRHRWRLVRRAPKAILGIDAEAPLKRTGLGSRSGTRGAHPRHRCRGPVEATKRALFGLMPKNPSSASMPRPR